MFWICTHRVDKEQHSRERFVLVSSVALQWTIFYGVSTAQCKISNPGMCQWWVTGTLPFCSGHVLTNSYLGHVKPPEFHCSKKCSSILLPTQKQKYIDINDLSFGNLIFFKEIFKDGKMQPDKIEAAHNP